MTDETFTAYDIRGRIEEGVSLEVAWNIGKALADWLPTYGTLAIIRGQSADEHLVGALIEGVRLQGRDIMDAASGDKVALGTLITENGLSGGVYVAYDQEQDVCVIELYNDKAQLINSENGLLEIAELVGAGNFVPAAAKGELTYLA